MHAWQQFENADARMCRGQMTDEELAGTRWALAEACRRRTRAAKKHGAGSPPGRAGAWKTPAESMLTLGEH